MRGVTVLAVFVGNVLVCQARAQELTGAPPMVERIVIHTQNVFDSTEAQRSFLFRLANALHVTSRPFLVRQELLFREGERYDSARVAETLRNLRGRGIFRDVWADTVRHGGAVDVHVGTADGWTTQLVLNANSTGDTLNWAVGLQELNFLGMGARVGVTFREEANRSAVTLLTGMDRIAGTRFGADGFYDALSDGDVGVWRAGAPFLAFGDRSALELFGEARRQRVLRFRDGAVDRTFRRRLLLQRARAALAPRAGTSGYLRVGLQAQVKREEYFPEADTLRFIPDTVTGAVGFFAELTRARFTVVTHYNGFDREVDLDLSPRVRLGVWLAPAAFGYRETGIGPGIVAQVGAAAGPHFGVIQARANGLFTGAGLDSGQVWVGLTAAYRPAPRHATVLHVEAGAREGTPPGAEFALGLGGGEETLPVKLPSLTTVAHGPGPRAFESNAFTGERMFWIALEQRAFLVDEVLGLLGLGVTAFVDYGGAWFADQAPRLGGDVGFGLRFGATRSAGPNIGRLDLSYRFGEGFEGSRWIVSFGRGFAF